MNFIGIDPIKMLIYSAVVNGLVAPLILFLIVQMTSNKRVVKEYVNTPWQAALGWYITGLMAICGVATIISFFL